MRRPLIAPTVWLTGLKALSVLILIALTGTLALPQAAHAEQGKKAAKPKNQIDDVPGNFVQLDVVWVPVADPGERPIYQGIFVRLYLSDTERYDGCVKISYVPEMLIIALSDSPIRKRDYSDPKKLQSLIESIIMKGTGRRLYRQIEVSTQDMPYTKEEEGPTNTCK